VSYVGFWHVASIRGMQHFGCFRSEVEVGRSVQPTDSVENDPRRS
jgi:hypothetical protein